MSLNLRMASITEKNKIATGNAWIALLQAVFDPANNPADILYLAHNNDDVVFKGQTYIAFNFTLDVVNTKSTGELPTVQLQVSNVNGAVQAELELRNGGIDAQVTVFAVNMSDMNGEPELQQDYTIMASSFTPEWATFNLGAPNPLLKIFPLHTYLANFCWKVYNTPAMQAACDPRGASCGYEGALLTCSHRVDGDNGCRAHSNLINIGAYPGVDSSGFRRATVA